MRAALLLVLAALAAPAMPPVARAPVGRTAVPWIAPPLAIPGVAPAVGRCTSDGVCTSTGDDGVVRSASRVSYSG